jgi:hypothetical protein
MSVRHVEAKLLKLGEIQGKADMKTAAKSFHT